MNSNESTLLEAIKNMLTAKAELGLAIHDLKKKEERTPNAQYHQQDTEDQFRIKLNKPEISMFDAISAAFFQTHSYLNIDSPNFNIAFKKQMDGSVVPQSEQELALKYLDELRKGQDMPVGGRPDKREHNEFTDSREQSKGLQDQKAMRKATGHEA